MPRMKVLKNPGKARTRAEGYEPVVHSEEGAEVPGWKETEALAGGAVRVEAAPGVVKALGIIADTLRALVVAVQEQTRVLRLAERAVGVTLVDPGSVSAALAAAPARGERAGPPRLTPGQDEPQAAPPADPWGEPTLVNLKTLALAAVAATSVGHVQAALTAAGLRPRISTLAEGDYPKAKAALVPLVLGARAAAESDDAGGPR